MEKEKDITFDLEEAKKIGKSVEFIVVFGLLFVLLFIFPLGKLVAFSSAIAGYAIVNGAVYINYLRIKDKWKNFKNK